MKLNEREKQSFRDFVDKARLTVDIEAMQVISQAATECTIAIENNLRPFLNQKEDVTDSYFSNMVITVLSIVCAKEFYRLNKHNILHTKNSLPIFSKKLTQALEVEEIQKNNPELFKDH